MTEWKRWFIMTEDGIFIRGRYHGTREAAEKHCQEVYGAGGYQVKKDNRNENHPINNK